jgi:hypothetical protein
VSGADYEVVKELVQGLTSDLVPTEEIVWTRIPGPGATPLDEAIALVVEDGKRIEDARDAPDERIVARLLPATGRPCTTSESEWRLTTTATRCFESGLPLSRNSEIIKRSFALASFPRRNRPRHRAFSPRLHSEEEMMGRGLLLWMVGVPIPVILLLWLFFGH